MAVVRRMSKVRIGKAAAVYLQKIWKNDNISLKVKTRLYQRFTYSWLFSPLVNNN